MLFITFRYPPDPAAGGAEHQARLQAEALARRGHSVAVVTRRAGLVRGTLEAGVRVTRLPIVDRSPFRTPSHLVLLALYLLTRGWRFDVFHVHLANVQAEVAVPIGRLLRKPVYVKLGAGGPSGEVARLRRFARLTRYYPLRAASRVQALSTEIAAEVESAGVPAARIVRLPNGVAVDDAPAAAGDGGRAELGLPLGERIVVYAGSFWGYKGVLDLAEAWRGPARPAATLVMVGHRPERPPGQVEIEPLPDGVLVREWTDAVGRYLRAADAFVLPSHSEGMSNVLLEAMALGLPVVATTVGAATSMISDGDNGLLVAPGDVPQLRQAVTRVVEDAELARRLGARAAASIRERFAIDVVVTEIERVYEELLAEG